MSVKSLLVDGSAKTSSVASAAGALDDRGRLRLPIDFRQTIEAHPEWFLVGENEQTLHLKPAWELATG